MKQLGFWDGNNTIEIVEIDGKAYALDGWNGEKYLNCWECTGKFYETASTETYTVIPVYEEIAEDEFEITGYTVA